VREVFSSDVPLKQVFMAPTVEQFAAALLDHSPEDRDAIETAADLLVKLGQLTEAELDAALERESMGV